MTYIKNTWKRIESIISFKSNDNNKDETIANSKDITTVKPVYNDHLRDEVSVVSIDRWSL